MRPASSAHSGWCLFEIFECEAVQGDKEIVSSIYLLLYHDIFSRDIPPRTMNRYRFDIVSTTPFSSGAVSHVTLTYCVIAGYSVPVIILPYISCCGRRAAIDAPVPCRAAPCRAVPRGLPYGLHHIGKNVAGLTFQTIYALPGLFNHRGQ